MPRWRLLAAAAALSAYALLSWSLMTWWPNSPWAVATLLAYRRLERHLLPEWRA